MEENQCVRELRARLRPELFKALCDPSRLALLARLASTATPMNVSDASACCGVHISGTSRHLKLLERAGVVRAHKVGREVRYTLDAGSVVGALRDLADAIEDCCRKSGCCGVSAGEEKDDAGA